MIVIACMSVDSIKSRPTARSINMTATTATPSTRLPSTSAASLAANQTTELCHSSTAGTASGRVDTAVFDQCVPQLEHRYNAAARPTASEVDGLADWS